MVKKGRLAGSLTRSPTTEDSPRPDSGTETHRHRQGRTPRWRSDINAVGVAELMLLDARGGAAMSTDADVPPVRQ